MSEKIQKFADLIYKRKVTNIVPEHKVVGFARNYSNGTSASLDCNCICNQDCGGACNS